MLKVGTTEGRFRMVMPDLMAAFEATRHETNGSRKTDCNDAIQIRGFMGDAVELRKMVSSGELDLAFSGLAPQTGMDTESRLILDEQLFFVISDHMLEEYRPEYIRNGKRPESTVNLRDFTKVPVSRSLAHLHCMKILDKVLDREKISLNCVHVSGHYDLHLELAVRDYAACFCLGMYLPYLKKTNGNHKDDLARDVFVKLLEEKCRDIEKLQAGI